MAAELLGWRPPELAVAEGEPGYTGQRHGQRHLHLFFSM
jgi:hypothetical protein